MPFAISHAVQDLRKIIDRIGPENEVEVRSALEEGFLIELAHTAAHSDDRAVSSRSGLLEFLEFP